MRCLSFLWICDGHGVAGRTDGRVCMRVMDNVVLYVFAFNAVADPAGAQSL